MAVMERTEQQEVCPDCSGPLETIAEQEDGVCTECWYDRQERQALRYEREEDW